MSNNRKKPESNKVKTDFLNKLNQVSAEEAKNVYQNNIQPEETGDLLYIDLDLLEDAPNDWNEYPRLKEDQPDEYLELKMSIYNKGIQQPLLIYKKDDGKYTIIAGHNRRDCSREIIEDNKEDPEFDEDKFRRLPCKIVENITEEDIKELIDDTNISREFGKMPRNIQLSITMRKMKAYKRRFYSQGETMEHLGREMGLKKSAIYDLFSIAEKVIDPFQKLYFNGTITKKAILSVANMDKLTQEWIISEYEGAMTNEKAEKLKRGLGRDDIKEIFEGNALRMKKVVLQVPENRVEEFKKMAHDWLKCIE